MTVPYRNKFANYMNDANGRYAPVGSILPVFVDQASTSGYGNYPEYSYRDYLYCDGRSLNIRDYPQLYSMIGNTYGGANSVTKTASNQAGAIKRSFWINDEMHFVLVFDSGINSTLKMPYPFESNFRVVQRGSFPVGIFDQFTFYRMTVSEYDYSAYYTNDGTEFVYKVVFPDTVNTSLLDQIGSTLDFTNLGGATHPQIIFQKSFNFQDYPRNIGTFNLPDYRDRVIVGYGPVDGQGSPTVENALVNNVGQFGGSWYISKDTLLDAGLFFSVGDVRTRGYANITTDVSSFITGQAEYTIGPIDDYIFSRPVEHFHYILSSEPDQSFVSEFSGNPVDQYAAIYSLSRSNIIPFEPETGGGLPLGHSHGLIGSSFNDPKLATVGNSAGIGDNDGNGGYPVTSSPAISVSSLTYDSANNVVVANTAEAHGFAAGDFITITGAIPAEYTGSFEVLSNGLGQTTFQYTPLSVPGSSPAAGLITVRLATGKFEDQIVNPPPRAYVVNEASVIGGKTQTFEIPGVGTVFSNQQLVTSGTLNTTPIDPSVGNLNRIEINLIAPGGGGADTDSSGGNGGYAYATFSIDGTVYTVYAYGGQGGTSGSSGGAGGLGGTISVPQALINLGPDIFDYSFSNGENGSSGGGAGASNSDIPGGGVAGVAGAGGNGKAKSFTTTSSSTSSYSSSGTWTAPASGSGEVSRTVTVSASGGGGGNGNPNANSGCSSPAIGGSGTPGALVTATLNVTPSSLSFIIGQAGGQGRNERDGFVHGAGYEFQGGVSGASGASFGGTSGQGAYGNGATGGAGGGSTGVYFNGGNAIIGAGGGGGGGGSGGGYNGGNVTDGCYAGGSGQSASTNLHALNSAMDFEQGANGTVGGCTAGGGGGGGGGAGPQGGGAGGDGGQAGVGHNGNGGGTGGRMGDSAYRSDYCTASWGTGAGAQSNGYVNITLSQTFLNWGSPGGGGGQGASINMSIKGGRNVAVNAGLQNPGSGGGTGATAIQGFVGVRYVGSTGGGEQEGEPTVPFAAFYECDTNGNPTGGPQNDQAWKSSTFDGMIPTQPGLGTSSTNKFLMPAGTGAPTYGGYNTRYLAFTGGPGNREYEIGPFDFTNVRAIRFTVIKGNNFNGGATPEEDLLCYWKRDGSNTVNLLDSIISASVTTSGWAEYTININEGADVQDRDILLIVRQTRPVNQDDNATTTQDNYGISMITFFYNSFVRQVFTPSNGSTLSGIDSVTRTISPTQSGIISTDGLFEMSSSTPISTTALVVPENNIPLITRYHRTKYLIKAY